MYKIQSNVREGRSLNVIFEKSNGIVFSPQMWRKQEGTAGDAVGLDVGKPSLSWVSE